MSAPSRASARAIAKPMPLVEPVTIAALPLSGMEPASPEVAPSGFLEERLGARALGLLALDGAAGALDLGLQPLDVLLELGDRHRGQILRFWNRLARLQVIEVHECALQSGCRLQVWGPPATPATPFAFPASD